MVTACVTAISYLFSRTVLWHTYQAHQNTMLNNEISEYKNKKKTFLCQSYFHAVCVVVFSCSIWLCGWFQCSFYLFFLWSNPFSEHSQCVFNLFLWKWHFRTVACKSSFPEFTYCICTDPLHPDGRRGGTFWHIIVNKWHLLYFYTRYLWIEIFELCFGIHFIYVSIHRYLIENTHWNETSCFNPALTKNRLGH